MSYSQQEKGVGKRLGTLSTLGVKGAVWGFKERWKARAPLNLEVGRQATLTQQADNGHTTRNNTTNCQWPNTTTTTTTTQQHAQTRPKITALPVIKCTNEGEPAISYK
jgi:hypothetical protein